MSTPNNSSLSYTPHPTWGRAYALAKVNQKADPDWIYSVELFADGWVVAIQDTDGHILGYL